MLGFVRLGVTANEVGVCEIASGARCYDALGYITSIWGSANLTVDFIQCTAGLKKSESSEFLI